MAVTRIKNNQITDSTITYQKIASGTLVGSLFNANLTLNSNVSIVGNLQVSGNTTTVNSIDTLVNDPLITLNNGYVGSPSYDVGILFNRALGSLSNYGGVNAALVWSETDGAFIAVLTTETGTTAGSISRNFKANLIAGNITAANNITAESATITTLNVTNTNLTGLTSTGNIVAASGTAATNYTTGALVVPGGGGVGITGDLWVQGPSTFAGNIVAGNIQLSGNINVPVGGTFSNTGVFFGNAGGIGALYAGITTYTPIDHTVLQLAANINNYAQVNFQNINSGPRASSDIVATADNGDDFYGYVNLGIASSGYNNPYNPDFFPNDSYLIAHGVGTSGNLIIISELPGTAIRFRIGDYDEANAKATITSTGFRVNTSTASTSTTSGALIVDGGAGIKGNIHAAAINATPIGNTIPSTGSFTEVYATNFSSGNLVVSGGYISNLTNASIATSTIYDLNATLANTTTLVATNFSTANAQITGGFADNFPVGANTAATGNFTTANATNITGYTATIGTVNTSSANITDGTASTLAVTNLSSGNVWISGGNITVANAYATVGNIANFSTGNARITGGNITMLTGFPNTNTWVQADALEGNFSNVGFLNVLNLANIAGGTINADLQSANIQFTGGYIDNVFLGPNIANPANITSLTVSNIAYFSNTTDSTNPSNGAVSVVGGIGVGGNIHVGNDAYINGNLVVYGTTTTINSTTLDVEDLNITIARNAGNAFMSNGAGLTVDGGFAKIFYTYANDSWNMYPQLQLEGGTFTFANITSGNITTLVTTNFSTGNAQITGGYADNFPIGANTASTGNFTTANTSALAAILGNINSLNTVTGNITTLTSPTIDAGNVTTWGANITQGNITTLLTSNISALNVTSVNVNGTNGNINTLVATNFSTGNARITGGYADNFPIGANTAAAGTFTQVTVTGETKTATLNATSNVYLSPQSGAATVTVNPLIPGSIDNMSIGATSAANVYASNFRAATSLWAAPTGPVWIRGGTGTSGINNIPIGAVTPSSGVFTTVDGQTINGTSVNATNGNVTTLVATNFSSGNVVISGGYITALTNAYVTTGLITNFSTGNAVITGGYADNFPIGANTAASGNFTTLTTASLNGAVIGNSTPAAGTFTELSATANLKLATGNLVISSSNTTVYTAAAGTANTTGALVITGTGGAAINGNVYIGQGAVINGNQTAYDTIIRGVNERSLLYVVADSTYDQVGIGGNITAANITQGAKLVVNSNDAVLLPSGTSAERPSGQGYTDVEGMIRYNTTTNALEYYGNGQWNNTGASYTVITSRTFDVSTGNPYGNVDGVNTAFTLTANSTTNGTLVSVNGVLQTPTSAYSVTGSTLTFTEAPAIGDVVDARVLTTAVSVNGLSSDNGYNQVVTDENGIRFYTGNVLYGSVENWRFNLVGDLYPVTTSNIGSPSNRVDYIYASNINIQGGTITGAGLSSGSLDDAIIGANIARAGHFTTLYSDSTFTTNAEHVTDDVRGKYVSPGGTDAVYGFSTTAYRSGKFFVQLSDDSGGEYQAAEVIAAHNGTTCTIEVYGVTYTGAANLATFSCNIAGGTAYLNASSAGANLAIKVTPTLMKI